MKNLLFILFFFPLLSYSQGFTNFELNPNGDVSLGDIVVVNDKLYFSAATIGSNQTGLWVTDGTTNQTMLFSQVFHGGNLFQYDLAALNGKLFFHGEPTPDDQVNGIELWTSDGTTAGTQLLVDINPGPESSQISKMVQLGNELFFAASDGTNGLELWKTDGTANGTMMVKDIQPGENSSSPTNFTIVGSTLFFQASDGLSGSELWKTDGSSEGTEMVLDIYPGALGSGIGNLTPFGTQLVFSGNNGTSGQELWITDGTATGTIQILDINPGNGASYPSYMTVLGDQFFFSADDGINGIELWISDGSNTGTQILKNINPGAEDAYPEGFASFNNKVYFAATDGSNGYEIWETDGTESGTIMLKDIFPGAEGSNPTDLVPYGANLYFTASSNGTDRHLYQCDGTASGTISIAPPSATNSNPMEGSGLSLSAIYHGDLYFTANFDSGGRELWRLSDSETVIEDTETNTHLHVFPNPTAGIAYLEIKEPVSHVEIEVFTLLGELVAYQIHYQGGIIPIQWEGAQGIYLLTVKADKKTFRTKIIKANK
jgi:ELWxxDGT repeat protein